MGSVFDAKKLALKAADSPEGVWKYTVQPDFLQEMGRQRPRPEDHAQILACGHEQRINSVANMAEEKVPVQSAAIIIKPDPV